MARGGALSETRQSAVESKWRTEPAREKQKTKHDHFPSFRVLDRRSSEQQKEVEENNLQRLTHRGDT